ncbi:MAG: hypothetical protein ACE5DK_11070 [Paracoccaceae bacterium]
MTLPQKNADIPGTEIGISTDDPLSLEIAKLPGALKARLVIDYLGLNKSKGNKNLDSLTPTQQPTARRPDERLMFGILRELAGELTKQPPRPPKKPVIEDEPAPRPEPDPKNGNALALDARTLEAEHPRVGAILLCGAETSEATALLRALRPAKSARLALALSMIESSPGTVSAAARRIISASHAR